jgi:hypothetical protein
MRIRDDERTGKGMEQRDDGYEVTEYATLP